MKPNKILAILVLLLSAQTSSCTVALCTPGLSKGDSISKKNLTLHEKRQKQDLKPAVSLLKRNEPQLIDGLSSATHILETRLTFIQHSVHRLLDGNIWRTPEEALHAKHSKMYFEQLLFERWSKNLPQSETLAEIDRLIDTLLEQMCPMYKGSKGPLVSENLQQILFSLENTINNVRLVLVSFIHEKSSHYRDFELHTLRFQFEACVETYRRLALKGTSHARKMDWMIQAVFELLDWASHEYSSKKEHCYSKVQNALAARLRERLLSLNETLSMVASQRDSHKFILVASKTHEYAHEFFNLNFPKNQFTRIIIDIFHDLFMRLESFAYAGPEKPILTSFDGIRLLSMRSKMEAVWLHLRRLGPANTLTPEKYWKLLQIKVDVRNWSAEIGRWGNANSTEIQNLQSLCYEAIKEVNRLKRTMDRQPFPESDSEL
ncbi:hypothetical protein OXX79_003508 [Metschnikowia pulcherrima]